MQDIGLINSHGSLAEGRFFFLPENITLYCIAPVADYCTDRDLDLYLAKADTAAAAMEELPPVQKYHYGKRSGVGKYQRAAVPDVDLTFYERNDGPWHGTFGVFPSLAVPRVLRVPFTNKEMHACMTSQTDCRDEVYEAIGDVRNRLKIGKESTLSEVIMKVSKMDKFPKKIILLACRYCESSEMCNQTQWMVDYLNMITQVFDDDSWEEFDEKVDEKGSFDYNDLIINELGYNDVSFMRKKEKKKKKKEASLSIKSLHRAASCAS